MSRRACSMAAVLMLAALPGTPAAQDAGVSGEVSRGAPGMVTARTFHPPPAGFSVAVSPYDDSELNLKLKTDFEAQLAERWQARLAKEAAAGFLLLFEAEVVPAELAPPPPSLGSARLSDRGAEVNVNVWSTTQDSVLGGRQEAPEGGSNVFHINAVLRDRQSGEVAWQGDAYYVLREPESERVARALVPPLVDRIGRTVVREPLNFD